LDRARNDRPKPACNLAAALRQGDIERVRAFLRAGTKPHWDWVCETMRGGHLALAEVLLESGVERNIFTMAAVGDSYGVRRRLRRMPGDACRAATMNPASQNVTPLHVGCSSDWKSHGPDRQMAQVDVVDALHEHGADLSAQARYRGIGTATPLFCACWSSRNLGLVQWLLNRGAVATDACFAVALGHLQRHGKAAYDIAETLLAKGVPVDGTPGGRTPLQGFAHQGVHQTVSWLIAHGADVNARAPGGRTAAHFAAERNTGPRTLELLVAGGADLAARDADGNTPLDLAKLHEKVRIVEWIKRTMCAKRR
jgi:hypothetical protein